MRSRRNDKPLLYAGGIVCAATWPMTIPHKPEPPPPVTQPEQPGTKPTDPDPKSHPIHREVPNQPIHEGTDPKKPVREEPKRSREDRT